MRKNLTQIYLVLIAFFCSFNVFAQYTLNRAFPNMAALSKPLEMVSPNDGTNRLFIVQQNGIIYVIPNNSSVSTPKTFLNISDSVYSQQNEMGLLGLAFHPDYKTNGYFYVNYNRHIGSTDYTYVCRYQVSSTNPDSAVKTSKKLLMKFVQPYTNHNGGCMRFGPDGYLYIAQGDGGSSNDPQNHAQDLGSFLGKILRININSETAPRAYSIPADNPFVSTLNAAPEVFAYGMRNTWRFSFDPENGMLWAGDVGQNYLEEVDIIEKGKNYGWRTMEGFQCRGGVAGCNKTGLALPVYDYYNCAVDGQGNCSVTGGYVYRGTAVPELTGKYIFGDYTSGRVWSLAYQQNVDTTVTQIFDATFTISSFAVDQNKELYAIGHSTGFIYKLAKPVTTGIGESEAESSHQVFIYPNPAEGNASVRFFASEGGQAKIRIISSDGSIKSVSERSSVAGTNTLTLETNHLDKGVYFIEILQNGQKQTAKLIRQ